MAKDIRHFLYEKLLMEVVERTGVLPQGYAKDVAFVTSVVMVPTGVYQVAANIAIKAIGIPLTRIHSPNVKTGSARVSSSGLRSAPIRNYGVRRIGGRLLSGGLGALMMAGSFLGPARSMSEWFTDQSFDPTGTS